MIYPLDRVIPALNNRGLVSGMGHQISWINLLIHSQQTTKIFKPKLSENPQNCGLPNSCCGSLSSVHFCAGLWSHYLLNVFTQKPKEMDVCYRKLFFYRFRHIFVFFFFFFFFGGGGGKGVGVAQEEVSSFKSPQRLSPGGGRGWGYSKTLWEGACRYWLLSTM